jgi:hypothetical protein
MMQRNGRAELESSKQGKPCIVTFTQKGNDIDVDSGTYNECREYCGAGAGFEGLYLKPARGCDPPAMKKSRAAFKPCVRTACSATVRFGNFSWSVCNRARMVHYPQNIIVGRRSDRRSPAKSRSPITYACLMRPG